MFDVSKPPDGMGLVSHEAPRPTSSGPVPNDDYHAGRPSERAW